jgi:adenylate cyclase
LTDNRVERRLAAILAADVAGYSRLTGLDEEGTHVRLRERLRGLADPKISHRGKVVKHTGDGVLAEFGSVVDAVMQQYYLTTREGAAEAIRLAHRALELDPPFGLVAALAGASHARNVLWGYAADPQFDRKEAVRLLRLALSIDDSDADTLAWAAFISANMVGDCESSVELGDRAVALNPNSHQALGCRGWVYRVAGLPEEAVRSFERAIRMSPVDPRLHLAFGGIGTALIELGRFDEAIVAVKKALRQQPSFAGAYRCLASAFAHLGFYAEAREAAARVLEHDPGFTISAWIARGGQSNSKLMIEGLRKAGLPE